jgi:hypothetical protein
LKAADLTREANDLSRTRDVDAWRALMLVLVSYLRELNLPGLVQPAFTVAMTYWDVPGGEGDLSTAKESCWAFLEQFESGQDLASPDGRHVRALLCVLEPGGDEESRSMTAEWFAEMLSDDT